MSAQVPGPGPIRVGLGRSNVVVVVALLLFLGAVVFYTARGALEYTDQGSKILNGGLAVVFAVPLAMLLFRLPRLVRPRYVVVDHNGLSIEHGRETVTLPWPELVAVGIAYELAPQEQQKVPLSVDAASEQASAYLAGRAAEALQISDRRRLVLEIFARPDAPQRFPRLSPYWKALPPPYAGLPDWAFRFPLPPVVSIATQIGEGIRSRAPRHWVGWFARSQSGPST